MDPKLAILRVLAEHSDRDLSIDEIKREMLKLDDQLEFLEIHFSLAGEDIFRSGFISRNLHGWRITEAGLLMLQWLEAEAAVSSSSTSETSLSMLLEQMDAIERSARWKESTLTASTETAGAAQGISASSAGGESAAAATHIACATTITAVVSKIRSWLRGDGKPRLSSLLATLASTKKTVLLQNLKIRAARTNISFKAKGMGRSAGRLAVFALLGLSVCGIAVVLLTELSLFRRENAELQREISWLRANFSKLEQTIRTEKNDSEKSSSAPSSREPRIEQTAFQLSREETQLIRDFIKPAPNFSASGPTAAVGDPIAGTFIPLPSALVEKAPRLAGARFAIRGGNIIIVTMGSNKVDAVVPAN